MTTNAELQQRKEKVFARGFGNIHDIYADRALNAEIWDVEGNRYIDFAGGIAVTGTGHCNPRITAAVKDQLDRFSHTCAMVNPYESMVRLAERLTELTKELVEAAAKKGLILLSCGIRGNVIRCIPALTISNELIDEGLDVLGKCLAELTAKP